jgi:hypothetical protein
LTKRRRFNTIGNTYGDHIMPTASTRHGTDSVTSHRGRIAARVPRHVIEKLEQAEEFAAEFGLDSLEKMEADLIREGKVSGETLLEALYRKITATDDNIRSPDRAGGCFIKGTRVHTKEGLKPIEEIKVGDYVLSSPEDGSGQPEYKRVVKTFVYKNKTIKEIGYYNKKGQSAVIAATGNHPFWVEGIGWTRADLLKEGHELRWADGSLTKVDYQKPVYRFRDDESWGDRRVGGRVGFTILSLQLDPANGLLFDYENYQIPPYQSAELGWEELTEDNYLEVTVYNLEVEDFHTYYVAGGIWVHNVDCSGAKYADGSDFKYPDKPLFDGDAHIRVGSASVAWVSRAAAQPDIRPSRTKRRLI